MNAFENKSKKNDSVSAPHESAREKGAFLQDNRPQSLQLKQLTEIVGPSSVIQKKKNNTNLPVKLKSGIESLSGISMDDVKVHYNSFKPAQLQAHAYAQGTNIHIAPGQEKHLPHEAWHVVQQKQGRVQATTQMKGGTPINDDVKLEREADRMGERALMQKAGSDTGHIVVKNQDIFPGNAQTAPAQLVLVVENVPFFVTAQGHSANHHTFDDVVKFKEFIKPIVSQTVGGAIASERFWRTPVMGKYLVLINQSAPAKTIALDQIKNDIYDAITDAERLDTLDPEGPVPQHHELATFAEGLSKDLNGHSEGPVGYASKMMGKPGARDDFARLLDGISQVILTTGKIENIVGKKSDLSHWNHISVPTIEDVGARRPGLSIINYSNAIYKFGGKLAVCGVRGKILMDQFGLAVREYASAKLGKTINIETIFDENAVKENYSRLLGFFQTNVNFQRADTIVFGYASAFENSELKLVEKKKSNGWAGYLFEQNRSYISVFDSDLTHSYHGEILAQNVKLLLENSIGANVKKVLIGGSAGSLVPPGVGSGASASSSQTTGEESLVPNGIYLPENILRPDGFFKKNALYNVSMSGSAKLSTLPGSMHTSVVSVLAETPGVLKDLAKFGVKTVDMEFAYVAMVLGGIKPPINGNRDLADVKLGVACLVTDFPKTGAHGVALAEKDEKAKKATKALFVQAVIASMG